jgi:hypothetical protein
MGLFLFIYLGMKQKQMGAGALAGQKKQNWIKIRLQGSWCPLRRGFWLPPRRKKTPSSQAQGSYQAPFKTQELCNDFIVWHPFQMGWHFPLKRIASTLGR